MAEFYRFPHWALTTLVMAAALCIVFQTRAISYSIRRLPTGWVRRVENGMECAILGMLFLFAALLAQVQYGLFCGFLAPSAYGLVRQAVFLLTAVLGTTAAVGMELIWPFFAVGGAAVLLPLTETVTGPAYPVFFLMSMAFFLLRSVHICVLRRRELYTQLSSVSVKEAIDTLHTGLLFFRRSGELLLCNRSMEALARQMTGQPVQDGRLFQRLLECGPLCGGCAREVLGGQQVFRLPDSSVWSFSAHELPMGRRTMLLLTADDVTEHWDAVTFLARQNQALEQRGQELRSTIAHLQAICEAEEIARSKGYMTFWDSGSACCSGRCGMTGRWMSRCCWTLPATFPRPSGRTARPALLIVWRCCGRPSRAWRCRWSSRARCRRMGRWRTVLPRSPWNVSPTPCATGMPPASSSTFSRMTAGA